MGLKLSYFCKKKQTLRTLDAPPNVLEVAPFAGFWLHDRLN